MTVKRITTAVTAVAAILSASLPARAAIYTWTGGGGSSNSWYSAGNWDGAAAPSDDDPNDYVFAASTWNTAQTTIAIDGGSRQPIAQTLTFNGNAGVPPTSQLTIQIGSGNSLWLSPSSSGATTIAVAQAGVKYTIAGSSGASIQLSDDQQWSLDGDLEVSALIWNDSENLAPSLVKTGLGTLTLSGVNSFAGPISINQGAISVSKLAGSGQACNLGKGSLTLSGGTLKYTGATDSIGRGFALGTSTYGSGGTIDVQNAATTLTFTGAVTGGPARLAKTGSGTLTLAGPNSFAGLTTVTAGTLELGAAARSAVIGPNVATLGGGADIQGGALVFDYFSPADDPAAIVQDRLKTSYNDAGGHFAGGPMMSSTGSAAGLALGWKDDAASQTVTVEPALYGDANLDGVVNGSDLILLSQNWKSAGVWASGDFNYDGVVNGGDLILLSQNWKSAIAGMSFSDAITIAGLGLAAPEPGTLALLALASLTLAARTWVRRRHNK